MKRYTLFTCFLALLISCSDDKVPDVSSIKVNLQVERFEKDFFAVDTNNISASLKEIAAKYPGFLPDFTVNILGLPPLSDTSVETHKAIKRFISDYRPLKDSADKIFADLKDIESDIRKGLQFVKYYFPEYRLPEKLITFIGPMDAYYEASLGGYGDALTRDGMATGLQLHLGSQFSFYHSPMGQALYPNYISRRFSPEYIPVNCMKNIIDDIYPQQPGGKALVEQMIEKGKRLYVLDKLMPHTPDTLKIGYSKKQLEGCYANEGRIWNFFVINSLLLNTDPSIQKNYIGEAPSTPELGEGSPGSIGYFIGWQIVKKFMEKNDQLSLTQLLQTSSKKIFEESKYRPK